MKEISKERKKDSLVSAVAQVRMKDADAALKSMNNLLACHLADPNTPVSWPVPEELQDLYRYVPSQCCILFLLRHFLNMCWNVYVFACFYVRSVEELFGEALSMVTMISGLSYLSIL